MNTVEEAGFLSDEISEVIKHIRKAYPDLFKLTNDVNMLAQNLLFEAKPTHGNLPEMLISPLFGRALEQYQGAIILAERGMVVEAGILIRSLVDLTFRIKAICLDKKLAENYIFEDQLERQRSIKYFKELNKELPEFTTESEVRHLEDDIKRSIEKDKIKKMSSREWAEKANMVEWYFTAFSLLSSSVHTGVRDIEKNMQIENGELKNFMFGPNDENIERDLTTAMTAILLCLASYVELFSLNHEKEIQGLIDRNHFLTKQIKE